MEIFASLLYWPIGWLYLWIRYRNTEKVQEVLLYKYENNYGVAGALFIGKTFGIIFLSLVVLLILAAIIATFKFGIL